NLDLVRAVPRQGTRVTEVPADPDWVDASKFALQRGNLFAEVFAVQIGPAPVIDPQSRQVTTQPCLLIYLRLRKSGDLAQFQGRPATGEALDADLTFPLSDGRGRSFARQFLDAASATPSKTGGSAFFPVSASESMVAFAMPGPDVDGLR